MSVAIQQAEELRGKAIGLLLEERTAIEAQLQLLGFDGITPNTPQPASRKPKACSRCGGDGHTAGTCPNKNTGAEAPVTQSA